MQYTSGDKNYQYPTRYKSKERGGRLSQVGRTIFDQGNGAQSYRDPGYYRSNSNGNIRGISDLRVPSREYGRMSERAENTMFGIPGPEGFYDEGYNYRRNDSLVSRGGVTDLLDRYAGANGLNDQFARYDVKPRTYLPIISKFNLAVDNETKASLLKQTKLLEDLNQTLVDKQRRSENSKEITDKLEEYRKENKIKLKLLKQKQKLDTLSQNQMLCLARVNSQADSLGVNGLLGYPYPSLMYPQRDFQDFLSNQVCTKDLRKILKKAHCPLHPGSCHCDSHEKEDNGKDKRKKKNEEEVIPISVKRPNPTIEKPKRKNTSENYFNLGEALGTDFNRRDLRGALKKILWTMVYPILLEDDIIKKIVKRKNYQLKNLVEKQSVALRSLTGWMFESLGEIFDNLFIDRSLSYDFVAIDLTKGEVTDVMKKTRAKMLQNKILNILEVLNASLRSHQMTLTDLEYLASISLKEIYAQSNIFSNFEVMRFEFNNYGRIGNLTKDRSEMILAVNLLIRILVYKLIMGVKGWYEGNLTNQTLLNFQILGSVIYRLVYTLWERRVPLIHSRASKLPLTTTRPLIVDPNILEENINADEPEIIVGALGSNEMSYLFINDREWLDKINLLISDWVNEVYRKVSIYRNNNPQKLTK